MKTGSHSYWYVFFCFVWNHSQLTGSETIKWVIKICSYENSSCVNVCLRGEAEYFLSWLVEDCSVPKAISFLFDTVILLCSGMASYYHIIFLSLCFISIPPLYPGTLIVPHSPEYFKLFISVFSLCFLILLTIPVSIFIIFKFTSNLQIPCLFNLREFWNVRAFLQGEGWVEFCFLFFTIQLTIQSTN